jgi:hypothetical protein
MRRLFALLVGVAAATLSVGGCSSSDNGGVSTSSAGAAGENADAQCVSVNSAYMASAFLAATTKGGACADATDATTTCVNDMALVAGTCGKGCLGMGDDTAQAACVADCINNGGNLVGGSGPIGKGCMACYTADVQCAPKLCLTQCGFTPDSTDCADCRYEMGCAQPFYACSGFPDPRAGSAGEGGAGGATDAGSAGETAVTSAGAGGT